MNLHTQFYDKLMRLRMGAAALYDVSTASGAKPETIQKDLEPLQKAMGKLIAHGVEKDLPGVAMALRMMDSQLESYRADIKYLLQKTADVQTHMQLLDQAMLRRMKTEGVKELHEQGFMVTMSSQGGRETVTFR